MKRCKFCNAQLPDEAVFCLNCSSVLNIREEFHTKSGKIFSPKIFHIFTVLFLLIFSLTLFSSYRVRTHILNTLILDERETVMIPVTTDNGETVTDAQGNAVYEASAIESVKKKPTLSDIIDRIVGNDSGGGKNKDKEQNESGKPKSNKSEISQSSQSGLPSSNETSEKDSSEKNTHTAADTAEPEEIVTENPEEVFEYETYSKEYNQIQITKYKGDASFVTIPDFINGSMVVSIKKDAFANNSKIKTIDIIKGNRKFIWLNAGCFNNLSSLTTVNLYDNDLGLDSRFAVDCPIKDFNITYWQYRFVDGAIYSYNSMCWEFKTFCGNPCYDTLTLPLWCQEIAGDNNFRDAKNLKVINVHEDIKYMPCYTYDYNKNLEAINVSPENQYCLSADGVLFQRNSPEDTHYRGFYPFSKKDKVFKFPQKEGCTFSIECATYVKINSYVEEMYLPLNARITWTTADTPFPSLKKLYYEKGNPNYDEMKREFMGEIHLY